MEWFSYSEVMPGLATSFHVFGVDYSGHGSTTYPDDYPMTANQVGCDSCDARFGAAFYDGSWDDGFDHAQALKKISCRVLLAHANFRYLEDGLARAMSQEEADRAMSLLPNGE